VRKLIGIFLFIIIVFSSIWVYNLVKKTETQKKKNTVQSATTQKISPSESYIIVPYWTLPKDETGTGYNTFLYFGIAASKNGIDENDPGFKNLSTFKAFVNGKNSYLIVRMLGSSENLEILKQKEIQNKIIDGSVDIAKTYNFSGIVLDFETQGLPFDDLLQKITSFHALFQSKAHTGNLSFGTFIYGDVFYRVRPYDVEKISKVTDRIYIMTYDLSKAKGDPGPNFPLDGKEQYGYDFKTMVSDFLKVVPSEKLTFIFGMFGYDWNIDEKGRTKGTAEAKSTLMFEKFMTDCINKNACTAENNKSYGMKISYKKDNEDHQVWFETYTSVKEKESYLSSQNLRSIGFWAYSYF